MKRGPKPELMSTKQARGTVQPCRDSGSVDITEVNAMPLKPDWLTAAGEEIWIDEVGRVSDHRLATEKDTTFFGNYCNLQGAIVTAWRSGEVPPAAHLMEARKQQEMLGIGGARSRVKIDGGGSNSTNPFSRNGRR